MIEYPSTDVSEALKPDLIDVHAHLAGPEFGADRSEVLERARQARVAKVLTVGETLSDAEHILQLSEIHPEIIPAAGLYPTVLDPEQAQAVVELIKRHRSRLVAIGEVGMDWWKVQDENGRRVQRDIFRRFISLSLELDLPLNVHSRAAGGAAIQVLLEGGAQRVLLHAFDGRFHTALPAVQAGYFFSIPPSVVRSTQKQKLVKNLPLDCILLESDSPALGPEVGQRNEPSNILIALKAVAELKRLPLEVVRRAVVENTRRYLGLKSGRI